MRAFQPERQRGHALLFALFLMAAAGLGLFFLFSAGQITADKARVTNTADAAAYSGALWRARVLNYDAYSNRAIVANEIGIAQAMTLSSWVRYIKILAQNINQYTQYIPYIGQITSAIATAAEYASTYTDYAAKVAVPARDVYKQALAGSQEIMHASASIVGMKFVIDSVTQANDPAFKAAVVLSGDDFASFTRRYTDNDRNRLARVVLDSRDGFTRDRPASPFPLPLSNTCWIGFGIPEFKKRGATSLASLDRWDAVDTHSAHLKYRRRWSCRSREVPLGWAGDDAAGSNDGGSSFARNDVIGGNFGNSAGTNGSAHSYANSEKEELNGYSGISVVRELDYPKLSNRDDPRTRFAVMVRTSATRTADKVNLNEGRMKLGDSLQAGSIASVSAAEVYFKRPEPALGGARADGKEELASLYNPYWQARLVAPTDAERAEALAWKSVN